LFFNRVTRCVCEKVAQNVAKPVWSHIYYITLHSRGERKHINLDNFCSLENCERNRRKFAQSGHPVHRFANFHQFLLHHFIRLSKGPSFWHLHTYVPSNWDSMGCFDSPSNTCNYGLAGFIKSVPFCAWIRVARFFLVQKTGKNIPNYNKIYQMSIKYTKRP
jgi:hypothetical protein